MKDLYLTTTKLAHLRLPGLPTSRQGISYKAEREKWERRERREPGGGWEYSIESLPAATRMAFLERSLNLSALETEKASPEKDLDQLKSWQRETTDKRSHIVGKFIDASENIPSRKITEFKKRFSKAHGISPRTLENWITSYQSGGYQALVPNWNRGAQKKVITPDMAKFIEKVFLQPLGPPVKKVHEDICKAFADTCQRFPTYRTVAAYINSRWSASQQLIIRDKDAWDRVYGPYVRRDWTKVKLNEVWFCDHKQIDVACLHRGKTIFPWLTVVEDALSRKFLGWVLVPTPDALAIGQAFLYGVSKCGPPKTLYVDRGKDFQSKSIAGKKEKRDVNGDVIERGLPGLVANVGTEMFYATGRNPREKIIESAFGVFTDRFKQLPGYRGHSVKTRPKKLTDEIKSKNLLTFEELSAKIDELLNERNTRPHSTTGKSPESYWEGYQALIPSQQVLDYLLMDVHVATVKDSSVLIKGLLYRGAELFKLAGEKVEVRRDPKDIRRAAIIYKNQVFGDAVLETPDHYRSEITLESVKTVARIRRKIKKYRQALMESDDDIDPLKIAVELDEREKVRMRDIRPTGSKVTSLHEREKLAHSVSETMRQAKLENEGYQEENTTNAGGDILTRYLKATAGKAKPIGRLN